MPLPPLGLNLWQFHQSHEVPSALAAAAATGYAAVEIGPLIDSVAVRASLDAHGLVCAARHLVLGDLDRLDDIIRSCRMLGCVDLCSSGLVHWHERSRKDYLQAAERLNQVGKVLQASGIMLHYHNHDFEFLTVDDAATGMDLLLRHGDPSAWDLCVDVGWVHRAGHDPVAFLQRHRQRISYLHLRDFDQAGTSRALGAGVVDLSSILTVCDPWPGMRWVMVEQEPDVDPIADATASRAYLRQHGYR